MDIKKLKKKKGFTTVTVILFFSIAFLGFGSLVMLGNSYAKMQQNSIDSAQAFYLAEAALSDAKSKLKSDYDTLPVTGEDTPVSFGAGEYQYSVDTTATPGEKVITATGGIPDLTTPTITRTLELTLEAIDDTLPDVFNYALMSSGDVDLNGNSHNVTGDVVTGDDMLCSPPTCDGVTGTITEHNDESYPHQMLDFDALKAISQSQGNYHSSNPSVGDLPTTFYYTAPSGGDPGIPNVVFVEGSVSVGGSDSVAGFYVVMGSYMTDGQENGDVILNGGAQIDGVVFVTNLFRTNGGGGRSNVTGGVMSWNDIDVNGQADLGFDADYSTAIESMALGTSVLIEKAWTEAT